MRLIKRQTTNERSIKGKGVIYEQDDRVIIDSTNILQLPMGTTDDATGGAINGHVRFNTEKQEFEAYQDNEWRNIRFKEPNRNPGITQQILGPGNGSENVFGPLDSGDADYPVPVAAHHILVFIENVFQIATVNYTLEESVGGDLTGPSQPYADGWYIKFLNPVPDGKSVTVLHNFDK